MAINESVWGPQTQWTQSGFDNTSAYRLLGSLGGYLTQRWSGYVLNQNPTLNELVDNSLAYCGILQDKRDFYKANAIVFHEDGTTSPLYADNEVNHLLWLMNPFYNYGEGMGGNLNLNSSYSSTVSNKWIRWDSDSDMVDGVFGFQCAPIFKQKINKILAIPYVVVSATNEIDAPTQEMLLGDWIDTQHESYPYLNRCFIQLSSSSNPGTTDWTSFISSTSYYFDIVLNSMCSDSIINKGDSGLEASYGFYASANRRIQVTIAGLQEPQMSINSANNPIGCDPDTSHYIFNNDNTKVRYSREYSEDLIEDIYHQIAFYGVFFVGKGNITYNTRCELTDPRIFCGTIDENGYTHGDYTEGEDNANQPQFSWEDTDDSNYDPYTPPPTGDNWSDNTPSPFELSSKALSNHWWKMTDEDLYYVMRHINSVDLENLDYNQTFGMNPIDGVLQLRRIYVSPSMAQNVLIPTSMSQVVIGELSIGIPEATSLWYISANKPLIFNCCEDKWVNEPQSPKYEDFRAYAPFTSITFYDAFCGVIDIEPEKILNKYITITQSVDLITGDKITSLYASPSKGTSQRQRIATLQGNCAEEIPINGVAVADYMRNKMMSTHGVISSSFSAIGHIAMGAAGATISASMGNVLGAGAQALGTVANAASFATSITSKSNEISHTIPSIVKISNGTNNVESLVVTPPTLIMFLPKMLETYNEVEYGDKTGFAGYKIATLQSCGTGTHVVSHPRVNISGTSAEEYMLIDQLQKGIYVKEES